MGDLALRARELGQGAGAGVLVLDRHDRKADAGERGDARRPRCPRRRRRARRGSSPCVVSTARTRPPSTLDAGHRGSHRKPARRPRTRGRRAPPRRGRPCRCRRSERRGRRGCGPNRCSGTRSWTAPGSSRPAPRPRRAPGRSACRAPASAPRSRPPRSPRPRENTVGRRARGLGRAPPIHFASSVIVRDGLSWNISPGACEVEPPVSQSGPCSIRTTSSHPRPAR